MARLVLTTPGEDTVAGGNVDIIGTAAPGEVITLFPGVLTLDPSFNQGGDALIFPDSTSAYTIVRSGSNVVIRSEDLQVTIPIGSAGIELRFSDQALVLRSDGNQVLLADQVVTNSEAPVGGDMASAPTATPIDAGTVSEDGAPVQVNLLSTANDSDGDTLSIAAVLSATTDTGRQVAVTRNGSQLTIDPEQFDDLAAGQSQTVTVRYTITDGDSTIENSVSLVVTGANESVGDPAAANDTGSVGENGTLVVGPPGVLGNDAVNRPGATLSVREVEGSTGNVGRQFALDSGALLRLNANGSYSYNPNGRFDGLDDGESATDSFTYEVSDGTGTDLATVTITVAGANDAPVANPDSFAVTEDVVFAGNVLTNDTDVDVEALTAILVGGPANAASFSFNADGSFSYTPDADYTGPDSFTYKVNDGTVDGNTVTVSLTVSPLSQAPQGTDGSATIDEDSSYIFSAADFGFSDPGDGDAFAGVVINTLPSGGQLELNGGAVAAGTFVTAAQLSAGQLTFTPPNVSGPPSTSFTFQVRDTGGTANGGQDTDQSPNTFTVNVTPLNDGPIVTGMRSETSFFREDGPPVPLDNGSDARVFDDSPNFDGGTLSVAITTNEVASEDRLGLDTSGTVTTPAAGVIAVGGVEIGTYTGGGAADLVFTFNANATAARVQELLRALTYSNENQVNPSQLHREVSYSLSDGDGGTTNFTTRVIVISDGDPEAFAPTGADGFGLHGFSAMPFALPEMTMA